MTASRSNPLKALRASDVIHDGLPLNKIFILSNMICLIFSKFLQTKNLRNLFVYLKIQPLFLFLFLLKRLLRLLFISKKSKKSFQNRPDLRISGVKYLNFLILLHIHSWSRDQMQGFLVSKIFVKRSFVFYISNIFNFILRLKGLRKNPIFTKYQNQRKVFAWNST